MNHTPSTIHHTTRPPLIASSDPTRFAAERSRDFVRLCRLIFRRSRVAMSQREIIGAALAHEAPGYYVDYDYALRVVGKVMAMPPATVARYGRGKWLRSPPAAAPNLRQGGPIRCRERWLGALGRTRIKVFFISPATALRILQRANTRDCRRP